MSHSIAGEEFSASHQEHREHMLRTDQPPGEQMRPTDQCGGASNRKGAPRYPPQPASHNSRHSRHRRLLGAPWRSKQFAKPQHVRRQRRRRRSDHLNSTTARLPSALGKHAADAVISRLSRSAYTPARPV